MNGDGTRGSSEKAVEKELFETLKAV